MTVQTIANIFETGRPLGDYGNVTVIGGTFSRALSIHLQRQIAGTSMPEERSVRLPDMRRIVSRGLRT